MRDSRKEGFIGLVIGILLVPVFAWFVAYADTLSSRFYTWAGMILVAFGLLILFGSHFRELARRYKARPGFGLVGTGGLLLGYATLGAKQVPTLSTWLGKVALVGAVFAFVGMHLIARAINSEKNLRSQSDVVRE